ncbi:MAG TPA: CPBP family intramembrane glutamic endopeptidase [Planctomycetota bacterium]|nr:CPBP family intramembrane glutamic endopeptidase [Planctomycetota bacterium]
MAKRKHQPAAGGAQGLVHSYLRDSRHFATGFLFILPLLIGYEVGILILRSDVINWAHGIIRLVFHVFGPAEPVVFAALIAVLAVLALRQTEGRRVDAELYGLMLIESVVYAGAMSLVCGFVARRLPMMGTAGPGSDIARDLVLSVGAGVYEEVLFRVVLMGALYYGLRLWSGLGAGWAAGISIVVSSLAFALCHHLGACGDAWGTAVLAFRFAMGVLFSAVYIYRGLGIVVYTHALYDILVSLSR